MSTLLIVFIAAGAAGLVVFFSRTKKILDQRFVLAQRMDRIKISGVIISIISADKKLFSLTRSFATPNEVIHYGKTKRQIKAIEKYVSGLEEACKQIAKINNNNIVNELGSLQAKIHKYINEDVVVGRLLTQRQLNLLTEIRSESITIDSNINSTNKGYLKGHYVLATCLLEKVKNIEAFK